VVCHNVSQNIRHQTISIDQTILHIKLLKLRLV